MGRDSLHEVTAVTDAGAERRWDGREMRACSQDRERELGSRVKAGRSAPQGAQLTLLFARESEGVGCCGATSRRDDELGGGRTGQALRVVFALECCPVCDTRER